MNTNKQSVQDANIHGSIVEIEPCILNVQTV